MEYWQKDIETMGRDQLQELQLTRLKETVKHAANSPFYKEVFEKNGITPDSIQTLDDLRKIPFTTKMIYAAIIRLGWQPYLFRSVFVSILQVVRPETRQ